MFNSNYKSIRQFFIICALLGGLLGGALSVAAQTTAFTYQGRLTDSAMPASGSYDMQFRLFDNPNAGQGTQQGATVTNPAVTAANGVFTVTLDFGASAFANGTQLYLEISVRPANSSGGYTSLAPRQAITSAPTAIQSLNAANATQLGGVAANGYLQTNGSGANLTNLNASNITSGNLSDAQLSANVAFRNQANTFTGNQTVSGNLAQTGTTADLNLTNGFVARGTFDTGAIPATGAGTRMMFYPKKAAFRAGNIDGAQWDDANIGNYSTAMGRNATASGINSTAIGDMITANGAFSTAIGDTTTASGADSTAIGVSANASGDLSTAMGFLTRASGYNSTALGNTTQASGSYSTAIGNYTKASGGFSTAMGYLASTNGFDGSFVYGDTSTTNLINATAANQFVVRAQNIWLGKSNTVTSTANRFIETSTGAYLSTSGVWTDNSSVNLKTNFAALDARDVLRKVLNLRIQSWNYKADTPNIRHIGVMAQDFYQAFQIGADNEHITAVDTAGVTMAAIQGLNIEFQDELKMRDAKIQTQQQIIERQQKQIDALTKLICASNASADVCRQEDK